jgi:hypothetical protein
MTGVIDDTGGQCKSLKKGVSAGIVDTGHHEMKISSLTFQLIRNDANGIIRIPGVDDSNSKSLNLLTLPFEAPSK